MHALSEASLSYQRLLEEAPYLSRCSDNKTAMLVRPRRFAMRWPYMQVNRKDMISWLVFDIDHDHLPLPNPYIWQDENLPPPNLIVRNRNNNKAHLYYAIVPVCKSDKARAQPIQYLKAIYHAMATRMKADPSYSGPVAKTPFHPWWQTTELHSAVYELGELADAVELEPNWFWGVSSIRQDMTHSRNCTLFDHCRYFAYSIVEHERQSGSYQNFKRRLSEFASVKNIEFTNKPPLRYSEVKSVVNSVSRWTWDKYQGNANIQRGVMALTKDLPIHQRQQLAAKRTHQIRKQKTQQQILNTCRLLYRKGGVFTISGIAEAAGLCRHTVRKYFDVVESFLGALNAGAIVELAGLFRPKVSGDYAVHQITGALTDRLGCRGGYGLDDSMAVVTRKWGGISVPDG